MEKINGGLFITLEGGEACGKSTQHERLAKSLEAMGYEVVRCHEPGGTEIGRDIRSVFLKHHQNMDPVAEIMLLLVAKRELQQKVIIPALERGAIVLCDRYTDTLVAYQGHAKGYNLETIYRLIDSTDTNFMPDLTLLYDVSTQVQEERILSRKKAGGETTSFDTAAREFHEKVREGFKTIFAQRHISRYFPIVTDGKSIDEITELSMAVIKRKIRREPLY